MDLCSAKIVLKLYRNYSFIKFLAGVAIALLPCVAASLVYSSTGILIDSENLLINAMVLLTTGRRTEMGLSLIKQPDEADKYSFLLAFWGVYAKIDFESEKYRKTFGGQRFLVSAVANIANPPLFDGHIEVLEAEKDDWRRIDGPILNVGAVNLRNRLLFYIQIHDLKSFRIVFSKSIQK